MKSYIDSLKNHMEILCKTIGARPTGSAKNKDAVDYAYGVLQNCGFDVCKQEFDCMDWVNSGAVLLVDGHSVQVESAEYSMPCKIESGFICIDTIDVLQKAEISDKVAVLYGELCNELLMPKNFEFYNPDEHKRIIALLEEKNPLAIITVNPHKEHIIQDGDFNIPCAVAGVETLDIFLQNTDKKVDMAINTKRIPSKSHNIIATYGESREKICLSAHIDTKPATPGALDNASGVSVLLALAESLSGKNYSHQIEIVLLNGEDYYSTPGEMIYMRSLTPEYKMAINVDGVGLKNSDTSVSFYECPQEIEDLIMKRVEEMPGIEQIEPWPMGDHMIFAYNQIPTIAITASNIFSLLDTIIHSPYDDMNNIDLDILNNNVRFLIGCVEQYTK